MRVCQELEQKFEQYIKYAFFNLLVEWPLVYVPII